LFASPSVAACSAANPLPPLIGLKLENIGFLLLGGDNLSAIPLFPFSALALI